MNNPIPKLYEANEPFFDAIVNNYAEKNKMEYEQAWEKLSEEIQFENFNSVDKYSPEQMRALERETYDIAAKENITLADALLKKLRK